jgi:hypothetical protein
MGLGQMQIKDFRCDVDVPEQNLHHARFVPCSSSHNA